MSNVILGHIKFQYDSGITVVNVSSIIILSLTLSDLIKICLPEFNLFIANEHLIAINLINLTE